jgi:hypothetical protein
MKTPLPLALCAIVLLTIGCRKAEPAKPATTAEHRVDPVLHMREFLATPKIVHGIKTGGHTEYYEVYGVLRSQYVRNDTVAITDTLTFSVEDGIIRTYCNETIVTGALLFDSTHNVLRYYNSGLTNAAYRSIVSETFYFYPETDSFSFIYTHRWYPDADWRIEYHYP